MTKKAKVISRRELLRKTIRTTLGVTAVGIAGGAIATHSGRSIQEECPSEISFTKRDTARIVPRPREFSVEVNGERCFLEPGTYRVRWGRGTVLEAVVQLDEEEEKATLSPSLTIPARLLPEDWSIEIGLLTSEGEFVALVDPISCHSFRRIDDNIIATVACCCCCCSCKSIRCK